MPCSLVEVSGKLVEGSHWVELAFLVVYPSLHSCGCMPVEEGEEVVGFSKLRRGHKIRERRPWGTFRSQQRMKWRKTTMCPR